LQAHEIPLVQTPAYTAKVLSGNLGGVQGAARGFYPIDYFDVQFKPGQSADIPVAADRSVFAIVVEGSGVIGERSVNRGDLAILAEGDVVGLAADDALRVIIVAGKPIREPVARYGPFVMNTPQEIEQAFVDYQAGRFGVAAGS
jgi:redox-sensitive bicupin YhaK (pirin superfamily)